MILPVEQQVAPLELCRRLKELGAPQGSLYLWAPTDQGPVLVLRLPHEAMRRSLWREPLRRRLPDDREDGADPRAIAAYTVAELGELLPVGSLTQWDPYTLRKYGWGWRADSHHHNVGTQWGATEAAARATLLISLVERGIVKWEREPNASA